MYSFQVISIAASIKRAGKMELERSTRPNQEQEKLAYMLDNIDILNDTSSEPDIEEVRMQNPLHFIHTLKHIFFYLHPARQLKGTN